MSIQEWGAIGEVIGGIAVVVTLIYLSIQLKQSNVTTHRNMYAQAAVAISDFWLNLAREPELHQLYLSMLRAPEALDEAQNQRAYLVMDGYLSLMESYYLHNQEYGERLSQERWSRILNRMLDSPGGREYWSRRKAYFHEEFSDYVQTLLGAQREADGKV